MSDYPEFDKVESAYQLIKCRYRGYVILCRVYRNWYGYSQPLFALVVEGTDGYISGTSVSFRQGMLMITQGIDAEITLRP